MIIVHLGREWSRREVLLVLDEHPDELDPETIFQACNRIADIDTDCADLPSWACPLRIGLDAAQATSMSTGDEIRVFTHEHGYQIRKIRCEISGWSTGNEGIDRDLTPNKIFNGHRVFFCIPQATP